MSVLLKLEGLALFLLGMYFFSWLAYAWWWFPVLLLTPDVGMIGYVFGNKIGAWCYNFFHHIAIAIAVYLIGKYLNIPVVQLAGVILFSHSAFDRMLGYGLKYEKGFKYTHLGDL